MYHYDDSICERINRIAAESEKYINLLYTVPCMYAKNVLLYQLNIKLNEMSFLCNLICNQKNQVMNNSIGLVHQNQRDITLQELIKFNGKDGNPAYVAINGVVYDVTNNAAWAAASHFGLTAGKDLTSEFASCHAGQPVLSKLKVVGKLI